MKKIIILTLLMCVPLIAQNVYYGEGSLKHITTGYDNSTFGINAGYWLTTGYRNILDGYKAGANLTTGYNNIFIGNKINADSVNQANALNIGGVIKGDLSSGIVTIAKLGASTISGSITAKDSTTSAILKDSAGKKWKLRVSPKGVITADSTGCN